MIQKLLLLLFFTSFFVLFSQEITGDELLEKAIQYHDPSNNWKHFNENFTLIMTTPEGTKRKSDIKIDLPNSIFNIKTVKGKNTTEYALAGKDCTLSFNGQTDLTEKFKKNHNLSCKRALLYRDYYTYLYGLPMKLKDEGTVINQKVTTKTFKDKEYLVLTVTYEPNVGKDTWYFYFNKKTYAMEVYQFFKTTKESGEYILLSDEVIINKIKMPKVRAWYYNKDDKYLGTDVLTTIN